jgi:peptidoglycan/LPS O-acetylase OafA/YrhL
MNERIPSLDGARAVSIGLVIAAHVLTGMGLPGLWRVNFGNLGVRTFFVISGFVITTLLLNERERIGQISLAGFYLRRAFRILPAYWLFVATVTLLIPTGLVTARYGDLPAVLAYFSNYRLPGISLGHTWSLSVEEQFYLLWPATIVFAGLTRARIICAALLIVAPTFRVLSGLGLWPAPHNFAFECVCDSLAAGCLLAALRTRLWAFAGYRSFVASPYVPLTVITVLAVMALRPEDIVIDLGTSLLNLTIAATLDRYMRFPSSPTGRLLNFTPIVWVGTISYGLYLWQQLFTTSGTLPVAAKIAAPLCLSAASYYLLENPARRWLRKKLARERAGLNLPRPAMVPPPPDG